MFGGQLYGGGDGDNPFEFTNVLTAPEGDSIAGGFGPGNYNDGYQGGGDRIYWGEFGADDPNFNPAEYGQNLFEQTHPPPDAPTVPTGQHQAPLAGVVGGHKHASMGTGGVATKPLQDTAGAARAASNNAGAVDPADPTIALPEAPGGDVPGPMQMVTRGGETVATPGGPETVVQAGRDLDPFAAAARGDPGWGQGSFRQVGPVEGPGPHIMQDGSEAAGSYSGSRSEMHPNTFTTERSVSARTITESSAGDTVEGRGSVEYGYGKGRGSVELMPMGKDAEIFAEFRTPLGGSDFSGDSYEWGAEDDPHTVLPDIPEWEDPETGGGAEPSKTFGPTGPDLPEGSVEMEQRRVELGTESTENPSLVDSYTHVRQQDVNNPDVIEEKWDDVLGNIERDANNVESVTLSNGQADTLVGDLPQGDSFAWQRINLDDIDAGLRGGLADIVSDAGNLSMGAEGIATSSSALGGFLRARGFDLLIGSALMPLFDWIDNASGTPWVSRGIQGTLALTGLVVAGDPFGVVAAPIAWGVMEYMHQRQRLIDNKDVEAERSKKFGYVREGDKWYPAILASRTRDEGYWGSTKTQITMQYGTDVKWKQKKGSTQWIPYFEQGAYKLKDFHIWDNELDKPEHEGGIDYQQRNDPLRDFYFMSQEDTTKYLTNLAGGDTLANHVVDDDNFTAEEQAAMAASRQAAFDQFSVHDDTSFNDIWEQYGDQEKWFYQRYGGYYDKANDVRKALEFMGDYRGSPVGGISTEDYGENTTPASEGYRAAVGGVANSGGWWRRYLPEDLKPGGQRRGFDPMLRSQGGIPEGLTYEEVGTNGANRFRDVNANVYLAKTFYKALDQLLRTRNAAGKSMKFDKKYDFGTPVPQGHRYYSDGTWEFGKLDSAESLKHQLQLIEESGDPQWAGTEHYRNSNQRSYLSQKAYCRYLYETINSLGGSNYMEMRHVNTNTGTRADSGNNWENPQEQIDGEFASRALLYSAADDDKFGHIIPVFKSDQYGKRGEDFEMTLYDKGRIHRTDQIQELRDKGMINDPSDEPDYVAGRYDGIEHYRIATGDNVGVWDVGTNTYVHWGHNTPGSTYNPETDEYEMPKEPEKETEKESEKETTDFFDPSDGGQTADFGAGWGAEEGAGRAGYMGFLEGDLTEGTYEGDPDKAKAGAGPGGIPGRKFIYKGQTFDEEYAKVMQEKKDARKHRGKHGDPYAEWHRKREQALDELEAARAAQAAQDAADAAARVPKGPARGSAAERQAAKAYKYGGLSAKDAQEHAAYTKWLLQARRALLDAQNRHPQEVHDRVHETKPTQVIPDQGHETHPNHLPGYLSQQHAMHQHLADQTAQLHAKVV